MNFIKHFEEILKILLIYLQARPWNSTGIQCTGLSSGLNLETYERVRKSMNLQ